MATATPGDLRGSVRYRIPEPTPPAPLASANSFRHNQIMFARKIRVEYEEAGQRHACPLKWLDSFSMRNFTNDQVFDDTIPTADGEMEIGARVPLERLRTAMEDWFRRKSYLPTGALLVVEERTAQQS